MGRPGEGCARPVQDGRKAHVNLYLHVSRLNADATTVGGVQ